MHLNQQHALQTDSRQLANSYRQFDCDPAINETEVVSAGKKYTVKFAAADVNCVYLSARDFSGNEVTTASFKLGGKTFSMAKGSLIWSPGHFECPITDVDGIELLNPDKISLTVKVFIGLVEVSEDLLNEKTNEKTKDKTNTDK